MIYQCYIYGLREVGAEEIRYIGQTVDPPKRLANYKRNKSHPANRRGQWVASVMNTGGQIEMVIIEECDLLEAAQRETYWLDHYRRNGHRLTNKNKPGVSIAASWTRQGVYRTRHLSEDDW